MQSRMKTLQRLVTLYAAVEELHSTELQRMAAAVREVQLAIGIEQEMAQSTRLDGREALLVGDREKRVVVESQQETAAWRRQRLEQIRLRREELTDAAREQYVASRLKREQMKRVFDDIAERNEIEDVRRMQGTLDDNFLARRRWPDAQEKNETTTNR